MHNEMLNSLRKLMHRAPLSGISKAINIQTSNTLAILAESDISHQRWIKFRISFSKCFPLRVCAQAFAYDLPKSKYTARRCATHPVVSTGFSCSVTESHTPRNVGVAHCSTLIVP